MGVHLLGRTFRPILSVADWAICCYGRCFGELAGGSLPEVLFLQLVGCFCSFLSWLRGGTKFDWSQLGKPSFARLEKLALFIHFVGLPFFSLKNLREKMTNERFNSQEPIARRLEIPGCVMSANFVLLVTVPNDFGRDDAWLSRIGSSSRLASLRWNGIALAVHYASGGWVECVFAARAAR